MTEKIKVLYLDDEHHNLNSFKATFRSNYDILLAGDAEEARLQLEAHPDLHVLLCDQRMPKTTGAEFLAEVRVTHPAPIRMLVSGYAELSTITDAINHGNIFRFIQKPWQELDMRSAIEEGYNHYTTSQALFLKNEELNKAYQELNKFTYSVTHDVRGPLHSALGAMELLKESDDLEEIRHIVSLVERSLNKLDAFIDHTYHYYTIRKGVPQFDEIDLNRMVEDLSGVYTMPGKNKEVRFETCIQQNVPYFSDRTCMNIILGNLINNAFKYQRRDEHQKFVRLEAEVDRDRAIIKVADNGIGVDDAYADHIFHAFYRATNESSGSGFGLYNVKDALEKLGGEITMDSVVGSGTTFTISIPNKQ